METMIRSTIVNAQIRIKRKRLLPTVGTIVTGVGQKVTANQTVARANSGTKFQVIPLSEMLNIPPSEVGGLLTLAPGARIHQGMPLIEKKRFMGRSLKFDAPYDGEFYGIKHGRLIIKQAGEVVELRALIPGRVIKVFPNQGVVLETFGSLIQGVWSTPGEVTGTLKVLTYSPDGFIFPEQITPDLTGAITAIGHIDQPLVLEKAADMGIRAVITGTMPAHMFGVAKTCGLSVYVTNGAGMHGFSQPVFDVLKEAEGRTATLFSSGLEAGRPEIIIPADKKITDEPVSPTKPLAVGQQVHLLRRPYTNQMAEIVHIYTRAQMTLLGFRAYGADVRLKNKQVIFVPFANMEAII
ncbi:MAG: hypothetical protein R6X34_27840 [Chloroflexota bacterium]